MGSQSSGYGQYCPTAKALEVLGERWTFLVMRELLCGSTRFNDIARGLPGMSRSLLTKRLRQLERAGIVERLDSDYLLTPAGRDLQPVVFGLGEWGAKWMFGEPDPDDLDAELLAWWMHDRFDCSELPDRRVVLHLRYSDEAAQFWFVIESGTSSVCLTDPGYGIDVTVSSDVATMHRVWIGRQPLRQALRDGTIQLDGPRALTRAIPTLFMLSPLAPAVAAAG